MTSEQFRLALHNQPFEPFTIRMADGRAFEVRHRDFVAQSQSGRVVSVFQPDDSWSLLDLPLMTELEFHSSDRRSA